MNITKIAKKKDDYSLYLNFFSDKIEKIVSAVYLITEPFPKEESLRWHLRKKGLQLLSKTMSLNEVNLPYRGKILVEVRRGILETVAFLEVSVVAKLVTEMNADILKREFGLLLRFIDNGFDEMEQQSLLSLKGDFFKVKSNDIISKMENFKEDSFYKRQSKGQKNKSFNSLKQLKNSAITNVEKKQTRRSQILKLFNKGQKLTIKDISQSVIDCGEKTIQRELVSMMDEGIIKKEGERRWSQYFLK